MRAASIANAMGISMFRYLRTRFVYRRRLRGWNGGGKFFVLIALSLFLLGSGYILGVSFGHGPILNAWKVDTVEQKRHLASVKRESQAHINALTTRVGLLQAHVNRLDALGNMLVSMANLDTEEFGFDAPPGVGGPRLSVDNGTPVDMEIDTVLKRINAALAEREIQLQVLNNLLIDKKLVQETYPQGRPVLHGWISSYFGKRRSPFTGKSEMHHGVDFAGRAGSNVIAVAGGVVTHAEKKGGYGHLLEIDHGNGYITRYAHNQMLLVHEGEAVKRGQVIARLGSTGRSTGPHVHFEVLKDGTRIDPMKFIR